MSFPILPYLEHGTLSTLRNSIWRYYIHCSLDDCPELLDALGDAILAFEIALRKLEEAANVEMASRSLVHWLTQENDDVVRRCNLALDHWGYDVKVVWQTVDDFFMVAEKVCKRIVAERFASGNNTMSIKSDQGLVDAFQAEDKVFQGYN